MIPEDAWPVRAIPQPPSTDGTASVRMIVTMEARVIRADGSVEDLGVIASSEDGSVQILDQKVDE